MASFQTRSRYLFRCLSATAMQIVQIKRTAKGQRVVTKVGRIPATLLPGNYACGMATLEGGSQPFYAATFHYDDGPDFFEDKDIYKEYVSAHCYLLSLFLMQYTSLACKSGL